MRIILYFFLILLGNSCFAQKNESNIPLEQATEKISSFDENKGLYFSKYKNRLLFVDKVSKDHAFSFYNETENKFESVEKEFKRFETPDEINGILNLIGFMDGAWIYVIRNFDIEPGTSRVYLQKNGKDFFLLELPHGDKAIHISSNVNQETFVLNTLNEIGSMYDKNMDQYIHVYDLSEFETLGIQYKKISCGLCSNAFYQNDSLYFNKVNKIDPYGGYSIKDIFKSSYKNISDSVKIASNTALLMIDSESRYIFGRRFDDIKKLTDIILDVKSKSFQMLIGRDYFDLGRMRLFYSDVEQKFAYSYADKIIYFKNPSNYPFNSLKREIEDIPNYSNKDFWDRYKIDSNE